ncbi:MAG: hypothetical protein JWL91_2111 [Sphingomonas bacterium]|nr:hypothetical protein [Sphingomonas bacterium]
MIRYKPDENIMISTDTRVKNATIVDRRSGPGYRLVLCIETLGGTPVIETLPDSFVTIAAAERHAIETLGLDSGRLRIKTRATLSIDAPNPLAPR